MAQALRVMNVAEEHRLDRIEQKLDKLTEAVSQIARGEEQMLAVFKRMDRHEKRLDLSLIHI